MKTLIYIHGFNSAPQSVKAQQTQRYFNDRGSDFGVHIAEFPPEPKNAMQALERLCDDLQPNQLAGFIGSSLGGYYSLYLHWRYRKPAVLVNPAVRPYELLSDYLGENENLYTGERYLVTSEHMCQLKALDRVAEAQPESLYLLTQTADEVLSYQEACQALGRSKAWIQAGGDHSFVDYPLVLPSIEHFFANFYSDH